MLLYLRRIVIITAPIFIKDNKKYSRCYRNFLIILDRKDK